MKKTLIAALAMTLALAGLALGTEITDLAWNESNIETLRALDKAAVARLINQVQSGWFDISDDNVGEFAWANLGDKKYELVVTLDFSGRRFFNTLLIYNRDAAGNVNSQELHGWLLGDLGKVIRDLDGDGKDELVLPSELVRGSYGGGRPMAVW